jgi:hypothetical protein
MTKIALAIVGFCIGVVLMPLLPFAMAALAWYEFDKGEYGDEPQ